MLRPSYSMHYEPSLLTVQWKPPSLPPPFLAVGVALLFAGVAAVVFREGLSPRVAKRLGRWVTPKHLVGMGAIFALIGALAIFLAGQKAPLVRWALEADRLAVQSLNGHVEVPWSAVRVVNLDPRESDLEQASLVLSYGDRKEVWLVLKWLIKPHRARVVGVLADRIPVPMRPVLENKAYREALNFS